MLRVNIQQKLIPFPKMFCKFVPACCNPFFFSIWYTPLILALRTCNEGFTLFTTVTATVTATITKVPLPLLSIATA